MVNQIAAAGLGLLLGLNTLHSQDAQLYEKTSPPVILVQNQQWGLYIKAKSMSVQEISDLFIENPGEFFSHYRDFRNQRSRYDSELDAKIFYAISQVSYTHRLVSEERFRYGTDEPDYTFFEPSDVHLNHVSLVNLQEIICTELLKDDPKQALLDVYAILFSSRWKPTFKNNFPFNVNYARGRLDSFQMCIMYYDIGRLFNFPFSVVRVRDDFYVKYDEDKFFDPLTSKTITRDALLSYYPDVTKPLSTGVFLTPLTKEQLLATMYARTAIFGMNEIKASDMRRRDFEDNIKEDPELQKKAYSGIQINRSIFESKKQSLGLSALLYFDKAIELDPNNTTAHYFKGELLQILGSNLFIAKEDDLKKSLPHWNIEFINESIKELEKMIDIDPSSAEAYLQLVYSLQYQSMYFIENDIQLKAGTMTKIDDLYQKYQQLSDIEDMIKEKDLRKIPKERPKYTPRFPALKSTTL